MISTNDIQKVSSLPIEQVADAVGLRVKRHWSLCPFHTDRHASLYFRPTNNRYRCYVCNHAGGPIDLVQEMLHLNFRDSVWWLAQTFGIELTDQPRHEFRNIRPRILQPVHKEVVNTLSPTQLAQLVANPVLTDEARHFLFDERRLDPRVIYHCGISSTHTHLLIPYFGIDGKLLTVQWRRLGAPPLEGTEGVSPRFLFPPSTPTTIYNLPILNHLTPGEDLYIAEGCSDCWAMLSAGHKAIAIPSATLLKPEDAKLLDTQKLSGIRINIFPDQDLPGERLFLQLRDLLTPSEDTSSTSYTRVIRHQLPEGCKDYAEYYLQQRAFSASPRW